MNNLSVLVDTINLREVSLNSSNKAIFTISNESKENTIYVKKIASECNCTIINSDSFALYPQKKLDLEVIFRPTGSDTGKIIRRIALLTNCTKPITYLYIKANVKP
jgi:hypothetical protein